MIWQTADTMLDLQYRGSEEIAQPAGIASQPAESYAGSRSCAVGNALAGAFANLDAFLSSACTSVLLIAPCKSWPTIYFLNIPKDA